MYDDPMPEKFEMKRMDEVGYLRLPDHKGGHGTVARTVRLSELMPEAKGPDVYLDFDAEGTLIGIEILT
jgi:hypothetical protein